MQVSDVHASSLTLCFQRQILPKPKQQKKEKFYDSPPRTFKKPYFDEKQERKLLQFEQFFKANRGIIFILFLFTYSEIIILLFDLGDSAQNKKKWEKIAKKLNIGEKHREKKSGREIRKKGVWEIIEKGKIKGREERERSE